MIFSTLGLPRIEILGVIRIWIIIPLIFELLNNLVLVNSACTASLADAIGKFKVTHTHE